MAENFLLRVTAGPSYDPSTHEAVVVNSDKPTHIATTSIEALVNIRIRDYRGNISPQLLFSILSVH